MSAAMQGWCYDYDFSAVAPSGQTLYYNIVDGNAQVTFPNYYYDEVTENHYYYYGFTEPTGALVIPDTVSFNGTVYTVASIGGSAFAACSGLTSVTIPNSVTLIDGAAFYGCSGMTSISIGSGVTSIENDAFSSCTSLTTVTIPNSVTSIGQHAFEGCSGLISVTFGSGVTSIDRGAFRNCIGLTSITIPNSVTIIGYAAFSGCSNLTSVTIGDSVTIIVNYAFHNCTSLTSVVFNAVSCTTAHEAFIGCSNITSFSFGDNVGIIPENICSGFSGLTSIIVPNSVTIIGDAAFSGCSGLTSIILPDSVTSIGNGSFRNCDHMTNITFGSSVATIGENALKGCTQIVNIHMHGSNPPTAQANTFEDVPTTANLYVPCDAASSYENAAYWSAFNIAEEFPYSFSATTANQTRGTVQVLHAPECGNLQAEVQANPYNGFHFVRWSDGNTEAHRYIVVVQDTAIQAEFAEGNVGIDDIDADGIRIYGAEGRIVVEGATDEVHVYDMMGRRVRGESLPAGVYMVKVGTRTTRKVVVVK